MTNSIRMSLLAALASLAPPVAVAAHEGHAGDHGWLAGASQPLLSVDHFLAGAFVALVVAVAVAGAAYVTRRSGSRGSVSEP